MTTTGCSFETSAACTSKPPPPPPEAAFQRASLARQCAYSAARNRGAYLAFETQPQLRQNACVSAARERASAMEITRTSHTMPTKAAHEPRRGNSRATPWSMRRSSPRRKARTTAGSALHSHVLFTERAALLADRYEQTRTAEFLVEARKAASRSWANGPSEHCSHVFERLKKLERESKA